MSTGPVQTWEILRHGLSAQPTSPEVAVLHYRVPRTIVIALVGLALGLAGALIQGHTRNPLADPGLLGISAGAATAVVSGLYFLNVTSTLGMLFLAFGGSAIAAVGVFLLGGVGRRAADPIALVVAGAAVSALLTAMTTTIVLRSASTAVIDKYRFWTAGAVSVTESSAYVPAVPFLAVGALLALASASGLNLLAMGDRSAQSLGLNVARTRLVGMVAVTLLAGAATAIAGPIAFLGLIAPHLARALVGTDYRWVLPTAALAGVAILYLADALGRVVATREVPAGVMLVLVGVPFFLFVVCRSRFVTL
ncbi:FecCD family ABC transporter permease [Gordonia sp. VNK21]|uniref:FecCD family ABC transporter permease n=1 Tax=Gordonia sp. VNK21 TaxID=3382483 RepID=UPI0038D4C69D